MAVVDIDNVSEIALFEKHGFEPIEGSESVVAYYSANGSSGV